MLLKIYKSLINDGLLVTLKKIIRYPFNDLLKYIRRRNFKKNVLCTTSVEDKFIWIYKNKYWAWGTGSVSGSGSTIKYTENLRAELPALISSYDIKSILDAPCGDFQWMSLLLPVLKVKYIGADIVPDLIAHLNLKYKDTNTNFIRLDLISQEFPISDLMICRDCLFHLNYDEIKSVLSNFLNSKTQYLLVTTHKNRGAFSNKNIQTGDFRLIDLFTPPFNFPKNPLKRIDDWIEPEPEREMCLFTREQVKIAIDAWN